MAILLHDKQGRPLKRFVRESLVANKFNSDYSFTGVKTVKIMTPQTVEFGDYSRSGTSRYGTPTEMQDTNQELTLGQDKSYSMTIDKGNNMDQDGQKNAAKMQKMQNDERGIPMVDKYALAVIAQKAGKVVANSTALTKATIADKISDATVTLDNAEIPADGRMLFVSAEAYKMLRLSDEFTKADALIAKSLTKGVVGEYDNMQVIKIPASRWPANVNFIVAHKDSATVPIKIDDSKLHIDPPGISGNLLEGRMYFDTFVFGTRCDGIYVEVCTVSGNGTVCADPAIAASTGAITSTTSGASFKYTTDGSDPRYSVTAKDGATPDVTAAGTVIKAYAYKSGCYPSAVTSETL